MNEDILKTQGLGSLGWPVERLSEALEALGRRSGFSLRESQAGTLPKPAHPPDRARLERWVEALAARLGLEAEAIEAAYPDVETLVCRCAPALLHISAASGSRWLVLLRGKRRRLSVLDPELTLHQVSAPALRSALCRDIEAPVTDEIDSLLQDAGIRGSGCRRARQALLNEHLTAQRIGGAWLIRPAAASRLQSHAREGHLLRLFAMLVGAYTLYVLLWVLSWWLLGQGALEGRLDQGWLLAWGLLLLTRIPFRLVATYAGGRLSVHASALLKRRLLFGTLRLDPEKIRHLGAGALLGRVMELETFEQLAIAGGFLAITALIELALSGWVLITGAGGVLHLLLLLGWGGATAGLGLRYLRLRRAWTKGRLAMTNALVEGMVGHRTRLAQEVPDQWHAGEDEALARYYSLSQGLDRSAARLQALVPRGWFILGVLGLVPAFVAGQETGALAIGVGGVVLAFWAFKDLAEGLERVLAAGVAWERMRLFWHAAARSEEPGQWEFALAPTLGALAESSSGPRQGSALLTVHDLVFRYPGCAQPVLCGLQLQVGPGERLLLEGPSGGGKSTLGMLLAACRRPDSGLVLLQGLDLHTLGTEGWRRRVLIVPQFHDNHVLMGSLAFNALLGRGWPPQPRDLEEAEAVCRALGLGPLLERMPAGLQQLVGETGWQLSHGERSRLYVARALLQEAELMILDESFAALDPQTLQDALGFVLEKGPTLIVIAHP